MWCSFEQEPDPIEENTIADNIFFYNNPVINAIKEYESAIEKNNSKNITVIIKNGWTGCLEFQNRKWSKILWQAECATTSNKQWAHLAEDRKKSGIGQNPYWHWFEHKHVLLLMDRTRNHLDVEMVEWFRALPEQRNITLMLVNDQYFMDNVCSEIWEMEDNQIIFS